MKRVLIIILLFLFYSAYAQDTLTVNGTLSVTATTAVKALINKKADKTWVEERIEAAKLKAGYITVKGDKGDAGKDGKDAVGVLLNGFSKLSVRFSSDYGIVPNVNFIDNTDAINAWLQGCVNDNIKVAVLMLGRYWCKGSLLIMKAGSFCTLTLQGESTYWDSNLGSEIYYTGTDGFAIGIQNGKGCKIRNITLVGLFQPPNQNDPMKFFNTKFEDFKDGICRDSRFSPYAAITIDPFSNLPGQIPSDGGYPKLHQYYGLYPNFSSQTGSTACEVYECKLSNFVVGIVPSVNGFTRNAEILTFDKIQLENMKLCFANTQDQEKDNIISNIYCWGGTHTIFANTFYGASSPTWRLAGNYSLIHANIAGAVVRFVYWIGDGYFPSFISGVYAESTATFGTFSSYLACSVENCDFDFEYPEVAGVQILITSCGETEAHSNIVFRSCTLRYYGKGYDMKIQGNPNFDPYCYFSGNIIRNPSCLF